MKWTLGIFRFFREKRARADIRQACQLQTEVIQLKNGTRLPISIFNYSASGAGFYTKQECLTVGDNIRIRVKEFGEWVPATVVSQSIIYFDQTQNLKNAIFRFSVRFENRQLDL